MSCHIVLPNIKTKTSNRIVSFFCYCCIFTSKQDVRQSKSTIYVIIGLTPYGLGPATFTDTEWVSSVSNDSGFCPKYDEIDLNTSSWISKLEQIHLSTPPLSNDLNRSISLWEVHQNCSQ